MIDDSTAQTLIHVARSALDRGRELEPHLCAELETIARTTESASLRADAEALLTAECDHTFSLRHCRESE